MVAVRSVLKRAHTYIRIALSWKRWTECKTIIYKRLFVFYPLRSCVKYRWLCWNIQRTQPPTRKIMLNVSIENIKQRITFSKNIMENWGGESNNNKKAPNNRFSMVQLNGRLIYMSIIVHSTVGRTGGDFFCCCCHHRRWRLTASSFALSLSLFSVADHCLFLFLSFCAFTHAVCCPTSNLTSTQMFDFASTIFLHWISVWLIWRFMQRNKTHWLRWRMMNERGIPLYKELTSHCKDLKRHDISKRCRHFSHSCI